MLPKKMDGWMDQLSLALLPLFRLVPAYAHDD
jgi:hypothetical protein